jgi:hypothetical protein
MTVRQQLEYAIAGHRRRAGRKQRQRELEADRQYAVLQAFQSGRLHPHPKVKRMRPVDADVINEMNKVLGAKDG